jgi:glycosyltransferase involved in cell wall biosynthesis
MKNKSLTVVVPAYNEQENLGQALDDIGRALEGLIDDYEIIVVNDGSLDETAAIAQAKGEQDPRILCISNESNQGYGYSYRRGVAAATKEYVGVFNGDNDQSWDSFRDLIKNMEKADIVSLYTANTHERPWLRRFLSRGFVILMNTLFGMNLKYFNGCFISHRKLLQSLNLHSQGLTALAECKVKLIRQGHSYLEIPCIHVPRRGGRSTALSFKSIAASVEAVLLLYREI